jgi:hypothetical protein
VPLLITRRVRLASSDAIDVLVILDDEEHARIHERDPFTLDIRQLPRDHNAPLRYFSVVYADEHDLGEIVKLFRAGDANAAFQHAMRGLKLRPGETTGGEIVQLASSHEPTRRGQA